MPEIHNPIQRYFWDKLTNGGLDLVDASRVDQLLEYATKNAITSEGVEASTEADRTIDTFETSALKELLDSNSWRSLLTDDGVAKLESHLGITAAEMVSTQGRAAPGTVPKGSVSGNLAHLLGTERVPMESVGKLFDIDYERQAAAVFNNPSLPAEERAAKTLHLLQDYAKVVNERSHGPEAVQARKDLLTAFFDKDLAKTHGAKDPDGDMLGTAWEIAWGTNPEHPESSFDIDKKKKWSAYMNMNGGFIPTAKKIDKFLAAEGRPAKAEAYEKASPLNWIVAEETGNTKASSSFREKNAISSTGVDFAKKLLTDESAIGTRTLDPGFDMKVDFYAWNNFVNLNKARGEKLIARHDETGADLSVEIKEVGDTHWQPIFKDAAGEEVAVDKVTSVVMGADGKVKGDGKADGSYSASWWGFCDRNAMQGLITLKYGFPQPNRGVTLKAGDQEFSFTKAEVRDIVGRRLTEIFPNNTQAGNRYDDNPDEVHLKDGTILQGKISSDVDFHHEETYRTGDSMVVAEGMSHLPTGSLSMKSAEGDVRDYGVDQIASIRRAPQTGALAAGETQDTLVMKDGTEISGSLQSKLIFGGETDEAGNLVLNNNDDNPILGELAMKTVRGETKRIPVGDLRYVIREDINEILGEEALAYIVRNRGVFAADSWQGSSVANGTRTVEEINRWTPDSGEKPAWIPADTAKLKGYKGAVKDPEKLAFFSMGNKGSNYGGVKFWVEFDENRVPINSNIISGQWDFLWGVEGKPDWDAKGTFNPNVPNDLVSKLYVNSLEDPEAIQDILPSNWRDLLVDQPAPATEATSTE